jgi:hypothetical protein
MKMNSSEIHPRALAKIEELRKRGLLPAKPYIPPQDRDKYKESKKEGNKYDTTT